MTQDTIASEVLTKRPDRSGRFGRIRRVDPNEAWLKAGA